MSRERILVFMTGITPRQAEYFLPERPDKVEPAFYSPVALVKLQKRVRGVAYPQKVIVLLTQAARQKFEEIQAAFEPMGIAVSPVDIPDGNGSAELMEIVKRLVQHIPDNCDVTLDITHGFSRAVP